MWSAFTGIIGSAVRKWIICIFFWFSIWKNRELCSSPLKYIAMMSRTPLVSSEPSVRRNTSSSVPGKEYVSTPVKGVSPSSWVNTSIPVSSSHSM